MSDIKECSQNTVGQQSSIFFPLPSVLQINVVIYYVVVFFACNQSMVTVENDSPFLNLLLKVKTVGYVLNVHLELSSRLMC